MPPRSVKDTGEGIHSVSFHTRSWSTLHGGEEREGRAAQIREGARRELPHRVPGTREGGGGSVAGASGLPGDIEQGCAGG